MRQQGREQKPRHAENDEQNLLIHPDRELAHLRLGVGDARYRLHKAPVLVKNDRVVQLGIKMPAAPDRCSEHDNRQDPRDHIPGTVPRDRLRLRLCRRTEKSVADEGDDRCSDVDGQSEDQHRQQ